MTCGSDDESCCRQSHRRLRNPFVSRGELRANATSPRGAHKPAEAGSPPEWVRLRRAGDTFTLSASNDGISWTTVGGTTVALQQVIYLGFP